MHALTSSIFLPTYLPLLPLPQRKALLYTYVMVSLSTAMSRGLPHIDVASLVGRTEFPAPPAPSSQASQKVDVLSDPNDVSTGNPWMSVIQSSLYAHGKSRSFHIIRASPFCGRWRN